MVWRQTHLDVDLLASFGLHCGVRRGLRIGFVGHLVWRRRCGVVLQRDEGERELQVVSAGCCWRCCGLGNL